ncbi:glycosyltransferase [Enterobacter sichuanensis]
MTVDVIVATYNGEKYIKEQLLSILNQSYSDIQVYVRDDGSTDRTKEYILELQARDSRINFIDDHLPAKGVGENFKRLLQQCTADYVFIADQDDVWDRNKVEELLLFAENNLNQFAPGIAYAPGIVVDQYLNAERFLLTNNDIKIRNLKDMILMNGGVQGCAMVINRSLYSMALRHDFYWYMHDQVLSLYAICFGEIHFLNKPLFKYRQHTSNVLGFNANSFTTRLKKYLSFNDKAYLISKHSHKLFEDFYSSEIAELERNKMELFNAYFSASKNKFSFILFLMRNKIPIRKKLSNAIIKALLTRRVVEQ